MSQAHQPALSSQPHRKRLSPHGIHVSPGSAKAPETTRQIVATVLSWFLVAVITAAAILFAQHLVHKAHPASPSPAPASTLTP